jgi:hypothetical protein
MSAGLQFFQELLFIHPVLESFATTYEDDWYFVGEFALEVGGRIYIDFDPLERTFSRQFNQGFFYDLAQMAAFPAVEYDLVCIAHVARV